MIDRVLECLRQIDVLQLATELVRLPTENPPGCEENATSFLLAVLGGWGLSPELVKVAGTRRNVVARVHGDSPGPTLILNGHVDVVPAGDGWTRPPFGGTVEGGRLYGRGACDMKGGVAAMLAAVGAIVRSGERLPGVIELQLVVDEEETQDGTRALVSRGLRGDFAIVGEPTSLKPCIAHKGDFTYRLRTHGRAAHASLPDAGRNAIYDMATIVLALRELQGHLRQESDPLLGSPTLSVGRIEGGASPSVVPDACEVLVDRRVLPEEDREGPDRELQGVIDACRAIDPGIACELEVVQKALPMRIGAGEPIVRSAIDSLLQSGLTDVVVGGFSGACDANLLVNDAAISTVILGPGDLRLAHKPDESVYIAELGQAAEVYARMAIDLLGR